MMHGSTVRVLRMPARRGLLVVAISIRTVPSPHNAGASAALRLIALAAPLARLVRHGMAAKLVAQCGDDLGRERFVLARCEARQQRERDDRRGHAFVNRGLYRPAALAGVLDIAADVLEVWALLESQRRQIEQPGAHDAAMLPDACDLAQVQVELGLLENLEAFAVRLEHAVLDTVVHHLDEVAGAVSAHVAIAVLRGQRLEDRLAMLVDWIL